MFRNAQVLASEFTKKYWKRLFAGGLPANKNLFAGGPPANKKLFAGGPPANKNLFARTPSVLCSSEWSCTALYSIIWFCKVLLRIILV